jgi:hypothetical protein
MSSERPGWCIFLLLLAIYLSFASLRIDAGDGETMYRVTYSLVTGQGLALPVDSTKLIEGQGGYGKVGQEGLYYAKYGLGWSLAAAPLCGLGRMLAQLLPGEAEGFVTRSAVMLLNPLLTAAGCALLYHLARCFYPARVASALALLYGLATIAWYYAKSAFSEPLAVLLLLASLLAIERRRFVLAGMALGGMVLTRQTALFLVVPVAGWALVSELRADRSRAIKTAAALLIPLVLGQLLALTYNVYRFGDLLDSGYEKGARWTVPLLAGLYNQLLSPGKGLFIYNPLLILGVIGWFGFLRRRSRWAWLSLALVGFYLVPHALYNNWSGGGGWGPRLLLPIVSVLLLPAGHVIQAWQARPVGRVAVLFLVTVSVLIQVLGVSVNWARHLQRVWDEAPSQAEYFYRVHYSWPQSPILGQIRSLPEVLAVFSDPPLRAGLKGLVDQNGETPYRDWQTVAVELLSFNVPDFWFVYLWFLGMPTGWLITGVVLLSAVAVRAALQLRGALNEG